MIAEKAGVSKRTVHAVLRNNTGKHIRVSAPTAERILTIAKESGYVALKSAREMYSGRSNNIGIIFHKIVPPFSEMVSRLQQEALQRNLEITPYITNMKPDLEEYYLNAARDGRVDAVMTTASLDGSIERYQRFTKPPYNLKILYYGEPIVPGVPSIHFDATSAGKLAARHLTEIGCRKPAFFGGIKNTAREKGFIGYFKEKRLPVPLSIFTRQSQQAYSFPEAKVLVREFLKLKDLPDGIFVSNDLLAVALLSEASRKGIRIPEDMAIVGCDNTDLGFCTTPTLTTIDTNIPLLAKKAIGKIEAMIKGTPPKPFHTSVPVSLVVRESTGRTGEGEGKR